MSERCGMKLLVLNGSPKKGINNTGLILDRFISGFNAEAGNEVDLFRMNSASTYAEAVEKFRAADHVLVAFPLYSYSMPAGVKFFFEQLGSWCGKCQGKEIYFLVQYGFQEAIHARGLEKYLRHLCEILGVNYGGTIIKGGCDGLSRNPKSGKKILQGFFNIGRFLGAYGKLDSEELKRFSAPEVQKKMNPMLARVIFWLINKFYWEKSFKKNGVSLKQSFARPYESKRNWSKP